MGWRIEKFGSSHEGAPGAVLPDGSEPKPVYFDAGSGGGSGAEMSDWWIYDGSLGAPRAASLRGSCSCGWRGTNRYPIDWDGLDDLRDADIAAQHDDWEQHLEEVRSQSVPLPLGVEELLEQLDMRLSALADDAPLAALKAIAVLERATQRIGRRATHAVLADDVSWETIGQALGMTADDAHSRLLTYHFRH
ncbi:hypothetical protein [Streptomyces mayteni]